MLPGHGGAAKDKLMKPSDIILKKALENYNLEYDGIRSLGDLKDIDRIDTILGAILDYLDSYYDHSHGE